MKKLSNRSLPHVIGKMGEGNPVMVLYHSPPYPRRRRTGSLPGPFTPFFFMLCMRKRKSRNLAPQVLIANKLSIVPSESHALKDINIGTYCFVLQRTSSCLPLPLFPTHTQTSEIFLLLSLFSLVIQAWIQTNFKNNC